MKSTLYATAAALLATTAMAQDLPQSGNAWFTDAQDVLAAKAARTPITSRAKNVIMIIGDGNGVASNYATRLFAGQQAGGHGDEYLLAHETFPYLALSKTYNVNAQTPDSAGTATAMLSGVKTKAGVIGVDESVNRGDCSQVMDGTVAVLPELASQMGKAVGIVTTARITHATPASGYAHAADRNFEDDSALPEGCMIADIATQLVEAIKNGTVDVAMGGGRRHFLPADVEGDEGKTGRRTDGKNLIDEAKEAGAQYVWNDEGLAGLSADKPVLGLFESSHMQYEHDRTGEPSLAEMTRAAIEILQQNENGFFLEIESGRIDHANHAGNLYRMLTDGVAFADTVAVAAEMTDPEDTLIIVTADHSHALAFNGYCGRGAPIHGLCYEIDGNGVVHSEELVMGEDGKPFTVAGYLNGSGSVLREDVNWVGARPDLTQEEATDPDYVQQALIPKSSESHSGADVAIYARGPFAHLIDGTVEQNYVFHVAHHALTAE